jgi:hypothetical protein
MITAIVFLLGFVGGLTMAVIRHPVYGLYTYVALFYLHPPSRWWAASLPDLRWAYVAALVTFAATLALPRDETRPQWYSTTAGKLLIVFTVWLWIQYPWALSHEDHNYFSVLYVKYIVVFYLVYKLLDSRERVVTFLLTHVAGCLYLGIEALGHNFSGRLDGVGGPGIDEANTLAAQLGTAIVIGAMFLLSERGWRWALAALSLPFIANTMVMAGSRGAFLSVVVAGVALWYLKPKLYSRKFYGWALLGLLGVGAIAHEEFWERMTTIKSAAAGFEEADDSAQNRMQGFVAQLRMTKSWPHGSGHRGTAELSPFYMEAKYLTGDPPQRSSHNTPMTYWVEQGIPGLILYFAFLRYIAKSHLSRRRYLNSAELAPWNNVFAAIAGGFTVIYVAGQFVDLAKAEVYIWLLAALASSLELVRREESLLTQAEPSKNPPNGRSEPQRKAASPIVHAKRTRA